MGNLVELVFEALSLEQATALTRTLAAAGTGPLVVEVDGSPTTAGPLELGRLFSTTRSAAHVRLGDMDLPGLSGVPGVVLRILPLEHARWDVELSVSLDDLGDASALPPALHALARKLAAQHEVSRYYAGLEPAQDEETRIFTGEQTGPLLFPIGRRDSP